MNMKKWLRKTLLRLSAPKTYPNQDERHHIKQIIGEVKYKSPHSLDPGEFYELHPPEAVVNAPYPTVLLSHPSDYLLKP